jgi:hypothetical protein
LTQGPFERGEKCFHFRKLLECIGGVARPSGRLNREFAEGVIELEPTLLNLSRLIMLQSWHMGSRFIVESFIQPADRYTTMTSRVFPISFGAGFALTGPNP